MADDSTLFPAQQPPGTEHPQFPHLFSPLKIGSMTVKNRLMNSNHGTSFARDGLYTDQLVAYQRERARGGAAIIGSQGTSITPDYGTLRNVDDRIIPWYQKVTEEAHKYGAKYVAELTHQGRQSDFQSTGFNRPVSYAPSPLAAPDRTRGGWTIPRELEPGQIREILATFAAAARRCQLGGVDAIELHFAHGMLVEEFMSPLTNHRTDEWGGSLENRLRFAREVLYAVREAVGREMVVGCRMTGSDLDEGGLGQWDMLEIAGLLDELKMLDYFDITMGHYSDKLNRSRNMPGMSYRPGVWARYSEQIKNIVSVPTFLVGRINHPAIAESLLAQGKCDMVVMARALIADPYFPIKTFEGRVDDIRFCVAAQDGCVGHAATLRPITCVQNPVVSRELEWGGEEIPRASQPKDVLVIGGGPAGLECARVAAERGHRVVLLERQQVLGGQVRIAAKAPERDELGQMIEWLKGQCEKLGVDIRLSTEATDEQVLQMSPEVVVVATGALPGPLASATPDGASIVDAWSVLDGGEEVGKRVVIVDEPGMQPAFSVAEYLAVRGHDIEYVAHSVYPGINVEQTKWRETYQNLMELGVKFHTLTMVSKVDGERVTTKNLYTKKEDVLDGIVTVVTGMSPIVNDSLYRSLTGKVPSLHLIGDAITPRGIEEAYFEGQMIGREI